MREGVTHTYYDTAECIINIGKNGDESLQTLVCDGSLLNEFLVRYPGEARLSTILNFFHFFFNFFFSVPIITLSVLSLITFLFCKHRPLRNVHGKFIVHFTCAIFLRNVLELFFVVTNETARNWLTSARIGCDVTISLWIFAMVFDVSKAICDFEKKPESGQGFIKYCLVYMSFVCLAMRSMTDLHYQEELIRTFIDFCVDIVPVISSIILISAGMIMFAIPKKLAEFESERITDIRNR